MTKAEEILKKHLKLKKLTSEHIHVAAYMSCLDAINEALGNNTKVICDEYVRKIYTPDTCVNCGRKLSYHS